MPGIKIPDCIAISLLLVLSLAFFMCKNAPADQPEVYTQYFENGSVQRLIEMKDGKKHGKMTDYYPDGKLFGERYFENDKQVGKTIIYYKSGKIKEVQYYQNGMQQGGDTLWYENGAVEFVTNFDQNVKDGYLRKWGIDGNLIFEARYRHDTVVEVNGDTMVKGRGPGLNVKK